MAMHFYLEHWKVSEHDNVITDTIENKQHKIEPRTMAVLMLLIRHYDAVVSRDVFSQEVWHGRVTVDESLTRCISELRRIFNDSPQSARVIKTVHKKGYKLLVQPVQLPENDTTTDTVARPVSVYYFGLILIAVAVLVSASLFFFTNGQAPKAVPRLAAPEDGLTTDQRPSLSAIRNSLPELTQPGQRYAWQNPQSGETYNIVVSKGTSDGDAPDTLRLQVFDGAKNLLWDVQRTTEDNAHASPSLNDIARVLFMASSQKDAPEIIALTHAQRNTYRQAMYLIDLRGKENLLKAAGLLDSLLEARPDFVMALIQKAVAVRNLGFYETAAEQKQQQMIQYKLLLKQASAIAPAHPVVNAMTYEFNTAQPNWQRYEEVLEQAVRFAPGCAICVRQLAEFYINVGYYQKAEALVVYHLDYFPLSTMMQSFLGQLYSMQGDLASASYQAEVLAALKSEDAFDTFSIRFNVAVMKEDEKAVRALLEDISHKHPAFAAHKNVMLAQIDNSYEQVKALIEKMPRLDFNLAITAGSFDKLHQRMLHNISKGQVRDIGLMHGWLTTANSLSRYYPDNLLKFKQHPTTVALLRDAGLFDYWQQKSQWPDYCRMEKYRQLRPEFCEKNYL